MLKELDHVAQLCLSSLWLLKKSVRHARKKWYLTYRQKLEK
jgi:hypothetical protein